MSTTIKTEVVLEREGKGLLCGAPEDFTFEPTRGSKIFHEGSLYEVFDVIQTVGDATSAQGSMLLDLLGVLYPEPGMATNVFGSMKHVSKPKSDAPKGLILAGGDGLVLSAQQERLVYVRLKRLHISAPKSIVETLEAAAAGNR